MLAFKYKTYFSLFVLSLVATLFVTPFVKRLALRLGAVDKPGGRKVHEKPTPFLGGLALLIPFVLLLGALSFLNNDITRVLFSDPKHVIGLVLCGTLALALGVYDDIRGVDPRLKLLAETAIAVLAYVIGFRISLLSLPFLGEFRLGILAFPVTILWVVGVTNAINLIDGLDGLAVGTAFFVSSSNFFTSVLLNNPFMAVISVLLMGTLAGFLRYNFPPASIFLGDTGSLFLGMVLSLSTVLSSQKSSTAVMVLVPVIALGLPIVDTLLAIFRRTLQGLPIFRSDRKHIHHALLALGFNRRKAVLTLYAFCFVLALGSLALVSGRSTMELAVVSGAGLLAVLGLRTLGYVKVRNIKSSLLKRADYRERILLSKYVVGKMARARSFDRLWELMVLSSKELGYDRAELACDPSLPFCRSAEHLEIADGQQPAPGHGAMPKPSDSSDGGAEPFAGAVQHTFPLPGGLGILSLFRKGSDDPELESHERGLIEGVVAAFGKQLVNILGHDASSVACG